MELKKYKIGDLVQVTRGASLGGEFYATQGNYVRLTCGNFDYRNNCFKENQSKDNIYYTGGFKEEFLLEKGDIITPLTEQAIGLCLVLLQEYPKVGNISKVKILQKLTATRAYWIKTLLST